MQFDVQLPATEESVREARDLVRERTGERVPAVLLYDLLTVVSELVANAVRHGNGSEVGLSVEVCDDGRVRGEVENAGTGRVEPQPISLGQTHGLGLHIVDALAERWNVAADGATRVAFELRPA